MDSTITSLNTVSTYMLHYWSRWAIHLNWLYLPFLFGMEVCMCGASDKSGCKGGSVWFFFLNPPQFMAANNQLFYSLIRASSLTKLLLWCICAWRWDENLHTLILQPVQSPSCQCKAQRTSPSVTILHVYTMDLSGFGSDVEQQQQLYWCEMFAWMCLIFFS